MEHSRRIARIAGPVMIAVTPTEAFNIDLFVGTSPPSVFLNGAVLFTAGVTILQMHWRWDPDWTSLITLLGWAVALGGLYRMAWPAGPQAVDTGIAYPLLAVLFTIGLVLTWQGYRPERQS